MNAQQVFDNLLKLLRILRPKFYNRLTWFVVAAGVAILSTRLVERLIEVAIERSLDIQITDGSDAIVGLSLVIVGLLYHSSIQFLDWHSANQASCEENQQVKEHDVKLFRTLDGLLGEKQYREIIDWIGTDHSYESEQIELIDRFHHETVQTSYCFLDEEIERARVEMLNTMQVLRRFVSYNFFVFPENQNPIRRFCMYPDLNWDRGGDPTPEQEKIYDRKEKELLEVLDGAMDSFISYRMAVKKRLHV